jgi:hypothetical protein
MGKYEDIPCEIDRVEGVRILGMMGPFQDHDADVYFRVMEYQSHVYCRRLTISGCAKAVGIKIKDEIAYQTAKAIKELKREIDFKHQPDGV